MIPRRVRAANFRSWKSLDLQIPNGIAAIIGENGAGKSSILQAIDVCLFGGLKQRLRRGETTAEVEVEIEHAGSLYRVRRHYDDSTGGKSYLDFEGKQPAGAWHSLTHTNIGDTEARIRDTFGITRDAWNASVYLAQGNGAAFTDAKPAQRKEILASVLGLGIYDALSDWARGERMLRGRTHDEAQAALAAIRRRMLDEGDTRRGIEAARREHAAAAEALPRAERELGIRREYEQAATQINRYVATLQENDERRAEAEKLRRRIQAAPEYAAADDFQAAFDAARAIEREIQAYDTAMAEQQRLADAYKTATRLVEDVKRRGKAAREEGAVCDACGQPIADKARDAVLERLRGEYRTHWTEAARLHSLIATASAETPPRPSPEDHEKALQRLAAAREAQAKASALAEARGRLAALDEHVARVDAEQRPLYDAAVRALPDAPAGPSAETEGLVRIYQGQLVSANEKIAVLEDRLEHLERDKEAVAENDRAARVAHEEGIVYTELAAAFGRDGIPALVLENAAIPAIESEAARILAELGKDYRVELRTQRALKSREGVKETLDIVITTDSGEALYEDFSGGERTRLDIALRIALARLLAHRRGADVRILVLDEPDYLDAAGAERLAGVLRGLRDEFDSVLLITHHEALRDQFDELIEVRQVAEESRIV